MRAAEWAQVFSVMLLLQMNWRSQRRTTSVQTHLPAIDPNLKHFRVRLRPNSLDRSQTIHTQHPLVAALPSTLQIPFLFRAMKSQELRLPGTDLLIEKQIQVRASGMQVGVQCLHARFLILISVMNVSIMKL